mgnify:CR=1 FL=1
MAIDTGKAWDVAKTITTVIIVPLFVWVVKLEVSNAVRDQQIAALEKKVEDLEGVNAAIGGINVNIGSLQTKIGDMDKKVDKIYDSLISR